MKALISILTLCLSLSLANAENTATYNPADNTYVNGDAEQNPEFTVVKDMQAHWEKVAENTSKDITYSYKIICDKDNQCKAVDPPKFQR